LKLRRESESQKVPVEQAANKAIDLVHSLKEQLKPTQN